MQLKRSDWEFIQNLSHLLRASWILDQNMALLHHNLKRVDDLGERRRCPALLCESHKAQVGVFTFLKHREEFGGEIDWSETKDWNGRS